jgi:hypothetical protein
MSGNIGLLFILAMAVAHSSGADVEGESVERGFGSGFDIIKSIQRVLEKEFTRQNIIPSDDVAHNGMLKINTTATNSIPASVCISNTGIPTSPRLQNRYALPEPQAQCDCNSQINAAKSIASTVAAQSILDINNSASKAVSVASVASTNAMASASSVAAEASISIASAVLAASMASSTAVDIASNSSAAVLAASASASSMMAMVSSIQSSASEAILSASQAVVRASAEASAARGMTS